MAIGLHGAISWFQKKIGTYDKTNWEITVEKQEISQVLTEKLSVAKLPTDLLDLDLIRGSTFTKAKPGYHWTLVTSQGFLKVLLFPFYYRWWLQQTSLGVWVFFVSLYFLQLVALVIYMIHQTDDEFVNKSWPEAMVPIVVMFFLGEMYIHVVSTNFTKPITHKIKKKKQRSERGDHPKRSLRSRTDITERSESASRGRNLERPGHEASSESRTNDTSAERKSREVSMERKSREVSAERKSRQNNVEHVLSNKDEDRLIRDSETEVDKSLGVRKRFSRKDKDCSVTENPDKSLQTNINSSDKNNTNSDNNNKNKNDGDVDNKKKNNNNKNNSSNNSSNNSTNLLEGHDSTNRQCKRAAHMQHSNASVEETSDCEDHSDSSTSSISNDEEEEREVTDTETIDLLFPKCDGVKDVPYTTMLGKLRSANDLIAVSLWDGTSFKKIKFTFFEIGLTVVKKVETRSDKASDYVGMAFLSAFMLGILPLIFRIYQSQVMHKMGEEKTFSQFFKLLQTSEGVNTLFREMLGSTWKHNLIAIIGMISRITLSFSLFFLLCVAESAYKIRYMYAKYFGALTSTRRARRNRLPHFRLHKVKNIKAWLSLRSFLKKRGPQRSVDTIVSMAAMVDVLLLVVASIQFLSINGKDDGDHFLSYFASWELSAWSILLGVFLIRFIALGSDINRKYRNMSILLIEQINLYVQMENNTKKKEELLIANNVLKLASKLLKELEGPFKVHGFIMNPLLSNITRVVVLSLFSGVMSDILGFRLRLWKIKA